METSNSPDQTLIFTLDKSKKYVSANQEFRVWMKSEHGVDIGYGEAWIGVGVPEAEKLSDILLEAFDSNVPMASNPSDWASLFGANVRAVELVPLVVDSEVSALTVSVRMTTPAYSQRELFRMANDLFSISDFNSYFLELNDQWVKVLGYTMEELKSQPFLNFLHPDDLEKTRKEAATLYEGKPEVVNFKNRYRTKNGDYVWLEWNSVIDYDRKLNYSVARDVTEHHKLNQQLRESEERYRSVVESLHEGIVVHDTQDKILMCNRSAADILGLTVDQLMGKDSFDPRWKALNAKDEPMDPSEHPSVVTGRTGQPVADFLMNVHIGNEERKIITVNSNPILNDEGKMYGVVASFLDVTKEKTAQENLRKALEMKTLLFQELHHRIKNNLNLISNLMYLKSQATDDPGLQHFVSETNSRILSIAKIHEQLLELEEADQLFTRDYLDDLVKTLIRTYASNEDLYEIDFSVENHRLSVDRILILGLITNEILSNTLKHAYDQETGGKIAVSLYKEEGNIHYTLGDEGKGMSAASSNDKSIGMDLIDMFCKQLGGEIDKDLTKGVKYKITFPFVAKDELSRGS